MLNIPAKLKKSIQKRGAVGTLKLSAYNVVYMAKKLSPLGLYRLYQEREFDRQFGVDTAGRIDQTDLGDVEGISRELGGRYETMSLEAFDLVMSSLERLNIDVSKLIFIDYGCGKGRALLLASRRPFRRIIGIEISQRLVRIAQNNISIYDDPLQRCKDVRAEAADALEYTPPKEPILFYFYGPFEAELLSMVLDVISRKLEESPREAYVLYAGAIFEEVMAKAFLEELYRRDEPPVHRVYRCNAP